MANGPQTAPHGKESDNINIEDNNDMKVTAEKVGGRSR